METSDPSASAEESQVSDSAPTPHAPYPPPGVGEKLATSLTRLSLDTASATPLPPTPQAAESQHGQTSALKDAPPPSIQVPAQSLFRRSPSAASNHHPPPQLNKKTSLSSLNGAGNVAPRSPTLRRTSSNLATSPGRTMGHSPIEKPPPPPVTAASVAEAHFRSELELYHGPHEIGDAKAIVVIHDSCYGHRFSRPRTSKASLNTIVERPERILASVLGVSTAYIRLGKRHADGDYPPHPNTTKKPPKVLPFRMRKTSRFLDLTSPAVVSVHGTKWMDELKIMCNSAESKLALTGKELTRSVEENVNGQIAEKPKFHEGDLYLCSESLNALQGALGGVCEGIDAVFQGGSSEGPKRAFVCIRPPGHHCSADYPSGFCWINNVHVGIAHATSTYGLTHAAIIDFDLHHGDGSQAITWAHNSRVAQLPKNASPLKKSAIGYFSLHDINSYPCEWGDEEKVKNASLCIENAHGQTIWNVHLQPWKSDNEFWELYESRYLILLDKARVFLKSHTERLRASSNLPKPKAAIFISAGFDASEWESPGMQRHKVNVPTEFYARFTRDIVKLAEEESTGVEGRVISVLEGGYSDRALMSGVFSHLCGLTAEPRPSEKEEQMPLDGLGNEISRRVGLGINDIVNKEESEGKQGLKFDPEWWSIHRLEELEALTNPPPPPPPPKKPRSGAPPTYSSPTQASIAKVVASPKRTVSNSSQFGLSSASPSRGPTPPPPEVDWIVAAHELSKILIPSDRQTKSCRPEELNAEASRARKERHSTIGLPTADVPAPIEGKRMLRERKAKVPQHTVPEEDEDESASSQASRRKTIGVEHFPEKAVSRGTTPAPGESYMQPTTSSARRSSIASSIGTDIGRPRLSSISSATSEAVNGAVAATTSRPRMASSSRPGSAAGTAANLAVKKTRAMNGGRGAKKEPPVPRIPSAYTKSASPEISAQSSMAAASALTTLEGDNTLTENGAVKNKDVDGLSEGMKKMSIKLKMPSKEEQYAREKARRVAEKEKAPAAKASKRSSKSSKKTPTSTAPPSPLKRDLTLEVIHVSPQKPSAPAQVGSAGATGDLTNLPSTPSVPPLHLTDTKHSMEPPEVPSHPPAIQQKTSQMEFIPYEPTPPSKDNVVTPPAIKQEPLVWLPPNTDTPIPATRSQSQGSHGPRSLDEVVNAQQSTTILPHKTSPPQPVAVTASAATTDSKPEARLESTKSTPNKVKREDLPVFTSTSPIPFSNGTGDRFPGQPVSLNEALSRPSTAGSLGKGDETGRPLSAKGQEAKQRDTSIWDVPETPAKQK